MQMKCSPMSMKVSIQLTHSHECVNATSLSLCLHYELVFHHKRVDAQFLMADVQFFGADAQFFAVGLL